MKKISFITLLFVAGFGLWAQTQQIIISNKIKTVLTSLQESNLRNACPSKTYVPTKKRNILVFSRTCGAIGQGKTMRRPNIITASVRSTRAIIAGNIKYADAKFFRLKKLK